AETAACARKATAAQASASAGRTSRSWGSASRILMHHIASFRVSALRGRYFAVLILRCLLDPQKQKLLACLQVRALPWQQRGAHQKFIDGVRRLAALADRPHDQRLAAAHVAGGKDLVD